MRGRSSRRSSHQDTASSSRAADTTSKPTPIAVPADALPGPTPPELTGIEAGAYRIFDAARLKNWQAASTALTRITSSWGTFRAAGAPPKRLGEQMGDTLDGLAVAVSTRTRATAEQAALDVANASLDLQLRYRPPAEINLARFALWTRQLMADAEAKDAAAIHGDVTTLAWIRDRIALDDEAGNGVDDQIRYLRSVADAHEFTVAIAKAAQLGRTLAELQA